jgi:hypothetical protein
MANAVDGKNFISYCKCNKKAHFDATKILRQSLNFVFFVSFERQTECEHQIRMDKLRIFNYNEKLLKISKSGERKIR